MPTKKGPRAKPSPRPSSAKASSTKGGAAAKRATRRRTPRPARDASPTASESLLTLTTANFTALRKHLTAGGRAPTPAAKDKDLVQVLKHLEAGYGELLRPP
jgi:hypothetical protein